MILKNAVSERWCTGSKSPRLSLTLRPKVQWSTWSLKNGIEITLVSLVNTDLSVYSLCFYKILAFKENVLLALVIETTFMIMWAFQRIIFPKQG